MLLHDISHPLVTVSVPVRLVDGTTFELAPINIVRAEQMITYVTTPGPDVVGRKAIGGAIRVWFGNNTKVDVTHCPVWDESRCTIPRLFDNLIQWLADYDIWPQWEHFIKVAASVRADQKTPEGYIVRQCEHVWIIGTRYVDLVTFTAGMDAGDYRAPRWLANLELRSAGGRLGQVRTCHTFGDLEMFTNGVYH